MQLLFFFKLKRLCHKLRLKINKRAGFLITMLSAGTTIPGIAVDPYEEKLYYTSLRESTLNMASLKTGTKTVLVHRSRGLPWAVALDRTSR